MAWKKEGDTAVFDPRVLAVLEHPSADSRSVNEVWGFFSRLTSYLALNPNDTGQVAWSVLLTLAQHDVAQLDLLLDQCVAAGLGVLVERPGARPAFQMVQDASFVHVKTKSEISFEQQRQRDNSDDHLVMPVRARDGDACRYCGRVVYWSDRKGNTRGTYDHRPPGRKGTWQTAVVCCGSCNSTRGALQRGDGTPEQKLAAADERLPLLPPPPRPYWSPRTREMLHEHAAILRQYGMTPPPLAGPDEQPLKPGTPAPGASAATPSGGARPATGDAPGEQARSRPETEPQRASVVRTADSRRSRQIPSMADPDSPGRVGTGRAGEGRAGAGRAPKAPPGGEPPDRPASRRRGRRGGRRNRSPQTDPPTARCPVHQCPEPCATCQHEYDTEREA